MTSTYLTGVRLSPSEISFVYDGVRQGIRRDGRALFDSRHIQIKTSLLPQTNGSARVRTILSGTDILCGIKLEVGTYNETEIQCTVEMGALARTDLFGPIEASKRAEKRGIEIADLLAHWLQKSIELPELVKNKIRWILYVDCIVLGDGGNLQDAISLATYCALRDVRLPETNLSEDGNEFDINPDFAAAKRLSFESFSLSCTCWIIADQIVVDPTAEEEACADCALSMNIDRYGKIMSFSKLGTGVVNPDQIVTALSIASSTVKQWFKFVDSEISSVISRAESKYGQLVIQDPDQSDLVCLSKSLN